MRKDTYRIGDGTFAFSPAVFDSLLGHGAKGAARMREIADAMHVSISSIKDWRRGTHAPSDLEKVEDIACWAHIDVADLLIESGDRTMDEKLTENQLDVLCVLWNQATTSSTCARRLIISSGRLQTCAACRTRFCTTSR